MRKLTLFGALALLFLAAWLIDAPSAGTLSTITVTTTGDIILDDGLCSLREAVIAANTDTVSGSMPGECSAGSGEDIIEFSPALPVPAVFTLTIAGPNEDSALTGDLDLLDTLTIEGAGSQNVIVDGNASDRVFEVRPGARVTITGLTIRHGNPGADLGGGLKVLGVLSLSNSTVQVNQGGGIRNEGGSVTLDNTQVLTNTAGYALDNFQGVLSCSDSEVRGNQGGGIRNSLGTATLTNVSILGNTNGGGVYNAGFLLTKLTLYHSLVMSNTTTGSGGGITNEGVGAKADIQDTRISGNTAAADGGGILNSGDMTVQRSVIDHNRARSGAGVDHFGVMLTLTNDTLSSNIASDNGGGLYNRGSATLNNVTLSGNTASGPDTGGNIFNDEAQLVLYNTVVAYSDLDGNCFNSAGFLSSLGHNLDSANTCGFGSAGDLINTDPLLGPLQDNGGATFTHALLAGSPAVDAGDNSACPSTDQRRASRPVDGTGDGTATCDIGSFEYQNLPPTPNLGIAKDDGGIIAAPGKVITYTLTYSNSGIAIATGVVISDMLPANTTFNLSVSSAGWLQVGATDVYTYELSSVAAGASGVVTYAVTVDDPLPAGVATITNMASIGDDGANGPDPHPDDNTASTATSVGQTHRVYLPLVLRNSS